MNSYEEMITVIEAHRDSKPVERQFRLSRDCQEKPWDAMGNEAFDFQHYNYRIKPEPPKPREGWICPEVLHGSNPGHPPYFRVREVLPES